MCGLEVRTEENHIVKVRGDKDNLNSRGYVCRKGLNIRYHQHHADRLLYPLKRVGDQFERISWDQAISEVAARLKAIVDGHGGEVRVDSKLGKGSVFTVSLPKAQTQS